MVIGFKTQEITEAEKYYGTIHLSERQKRIVGPVAEEISNQTQISDRAVKGFIWRTVREWQMKNQLDISEAQNFTAQQRLDLFEEIFGSVKESLARILLDDSQMPLLDKAMNNAVSLYKNKYMTKWLHIIAN